MCSDDEALKINIVNPEYSKHSYSNDSSNSVMQEITTPENSGITLNTLEISSKEEHSKEAPIPVNEMCYLPYVMPCHIHNTNNIPPQAKNMRIKKKITKAKERMHGEDPEDVAVIKKKQQMIRNRIAAQESRNRRIKEMEDLISENGRLKAENEILKQQLLHKQCQINCIYEVINRLSCDARAEFENKKKIYIDQDYKIRPFPVFRLPVFVSAMMFGIICIACVYGVFNAFYLPQKSLPDGSKPFIPTQIDDGKRNIPQPISQNDIEIDETKISLSSFQELDITSKAIICNECKALDIIR